MGTKSGSGGSRTAWYAALSGIVIAGAFALSIGVATAGKPPPPPPPPVDGGIVYFNRLGLVHSMNPDGTAKTALPAGIFGQFNVASPSRELHGGHRWFLTMLNIPGESFPNGIARREVFAVRDDAAVVTQLTFQADLLPGNALRWAPGDAEISWPSQRWVGGAFGTYGIYRATLNYDVDGNVTCLASQPASPATSLTDAFWHDWSPDGTRMVVNVGSSALWLVDLSSLATTRLTTSVSARECVWSPDGTRIAFRGGQTSKTANSIRSISVAGSDELTIVSSTNLSGGVSAPSWSPNGTHLVFTLLGGGRQDAHRVAAGGGSSTNLTADLDTSSGKSAYPQSWR